MNQHFISLVLGLSAQAEQALNGQVPAGAESLGNARQMAQALIDTLGMLQEKTRGNLAPEEQQLLDRALTELRFRFVQSESKG